MLSNYLQFMCFLFVLVQFSNCVKLRGVTIPSWPYVDRYNDNSGNIVYDGYAIELIDKIAKGSGFDYELYDVPDGKYGVYDRNTGRIDGLIGEVFNNRSDFAIADLTITDERKRFVDFTEPFMSSGIAAIVHKENGKKIQTFSDLYYQTELKYGFIHHSATHNYFHYSKDPIIRKMLTFMTQNPDVFVRNKNEGIDRANQTKYAFISELASLEFTANINCDLQVIRDITGEFIDFRRDYAIALRKGSKYLNGFNYEIDQLNKSGALDELRSHYWIDECSPESSSSDFDINSSLASSIHSFLILLFTLSVFLMLKHVF